MENDNLPRKTLLKPSEASVYFKVPLSTIYIWYQLGKIDGINVNGKSLRLFSKSVLEFLESRVHRSGDDSVPGAVLRHAGRGH